MGTVFFFEWEIPLMTAIQSIENGILTVFSVFFSMLGDEYLTTLIIGLLYWCVDKKLGRKVSLALSGTMLFSTLVKALFQRRRPYFDNPSIRCIRAAYPNEDKMSVVAQGFSLPSLHSSMSVSVYGTIARERKKTLFIVLSVLIPLLIGFSRVYLGVHYPTDVLSGWILGTAMLFLLGAVEKRFGYKAGFAVMLLVGSTGFFYSRDNEFFSAWGITLGLLLGFLFEEKYVGFEPPKKWWSYVLRSVLGVAIFALVNVVLKIPARAIRAEWLAFVYRLARYVVTTFIIIGPYTLLFKRIGI